MKPPRPPRRAIPSRPLSRIRAMANQATRSSISSRSNLPFWNDEARFAPGFFFLSVVFGFDLAPDDSAALKLSRKSK